MNKVIKPLQNPRYIIKKQFLQSNKYQQLMQQTQTYQTLFKNWLCQIIEYYKIHNKASLFMTPIFDKNGDGFIQKLQNQLYPFINSLNDITTQHLNFVFIIMRQSAYASLNRDGQKLIKQVNKLFKIDANLQNIYKEHFSSQNKLIFQSTNNIQFYLYSNWLKRLSNIQKYNKSIKNIQLTKTNQQQIYKLSEQLQSELVQFRKKIMNFKYGYLKQGVKIARKLLNCLAEYLTIGGQMLTKINVKLKTEIANDLRNSGFSISIDNDIQQFKDNYTYKAQAYRQILVNLQNIFQYNFQPLDSKTLFNEFNEAYEGNQDFVKQMFDVLNLFESFGLRRKMMYEKMGMIIKKIEQQFKVNKMRAQILTALSKKKQHNGLFSMRESRQLGDKNINLRKSQSQGFIKQFSLQTIEKSITQTLQFAMESFKELSKLCYRITQKSTEIKQTKNNMSISYQIKQIKIKNKKPNKNELWLLRDCRQFKLYEQIKYKYDKQFINKQYQKIKTILDKDQTQFNTNCQIKGNYNSKADFQIFNNKCHIISKKDNSIHFLLPFNLINSIQIIKKQTLTIQMNGGAQLKIKDFKNINEVESKLNSFIMKKNDNKGQQGGIKVNIPSIEITNQQLQAIKKRAPQFEAQRQKMDDYIKYGQLSLPSSTIQQVYTCIFSDNGSSPLNKNISFYQYFNQKNRNTNFKQTKYNQPGPYFYTGTNKQITFINCPIFSDRISQLDHPLPPIPLIPKSCHCKSQQKIYWISNKQLQYRSYVHSIGSKMISSFYTASLYKIKQNDNGVLIQIFCKTVFTQKTAFKGVLQKGAIGQIKNLIPNIAKQMQRCMRAYAKQQSKGSNQKQEKPNPELQQQNKNQQHNQQINNNNNNNKISNKFSINNYLVIFVIVSTLINLIIKFLF